MDPNAETSHVPTSFNDQHDYSMINTQPTTSSYIKNYGNSTNSQETILSEYSFFYKPPNDFQIYEVSCKEVPPFKLVSQLLNDNDSNPIQVNSCVHEFHFLKHDEEKCYKVL